MDIRFIIRLGAIFSFLLAIIILIYSVLGNLFSEYLLIGKPWNYVIPSVIIVFSFGKLKEWIEVISDKIFFQKKYRFVDVSAEVEKVIRLAGLDLEKSLSGINEILSSVLKLSASVIFVSNPEYGFLPRHIAGDKKKIKINSSIKTIFSYLLENKSRMIDREEISSDFSEHDDLGEWRNDLIRVMKDSGIAFLSPIEFQGKLIGVLALSSKLSNDYFSHEDFKLIKHISWQLSFAINNAQVYEELKKLDEEKSRFISVVSHQFRTPLTASRFNMELCLDGSINKKERDVALKDAYEGILSISNQLDKLLLVLEIEGGRLKPNFEEIDGGQIAVAVVDKARHLAEEKSMSLKVNIENDNLAFFGDADKVTKVLHILLDNSLHYAFPGGEIKLSVGIEEQGLKRRIIFSVADDGIGLNKENAKNITKKFYRGQDAISISPDGIGLDLFIAKKMVIAYGGELWYETRSKKGSIFKASFPTNRNSK